MHAAVGAAKGACLNKFFQTKQAKRAHIKLHQWFLLLVSVCLPFKITNVLKITCMTSLLYCLVSRVYSSLSSSTNTGYTPVYQLLQNLNIYLKGQCHQIFDLCFFSSNNFSWPQQASLVTISIFFEYSRRYSTFPVLRRCQ